jgi:hypothetical protein
VKTVLLAAAILASTAASAGACRLFSVNKSAYVAKNERVFRTIPVPPRAQRVNSYSIGQTASDSCIGGENGPPYESYTTWHVYSLPRGVRGVSIVRFYERRLPSGWRLTTTDLGGGEATFRRGAALFSVSAGGGELMLSVDYDTSR